MVRVWSEEVGSGRKINVIQWQKSTDGEAVG